jgi:hypothetical protein
MASFRKPRFPLGLAQFPNSYLFIEPSFAVLAGRQYRAKLTERKLAARPVVEIQLHPVLSAREFELGVFKTQAEF